MTVLSKKSLLAALAAAAFSIPSLGQENVVNIYSGRHYQTDEALYAGFTKATGIKVNRIEAGEDAIIERIPAELRHPEGLWFGFSMRARPIFYAKGRIDPKSIARYEDLADPKLKGKICIRSGTAVYNLSLLSSMI
ncbi:MAG TPA: Fe(3+) ABC transporter substrate-binding protein, partial [Burkholderiales bacterium]|nr:Fe(3+) ABC transporter substrate-binding protein [Burkholderiales bacterium]